MHMEREHEYGEECAIYPCEECGYRGQDKIAINQHVKEYHTSNVNSTTINLETSSNTTLEEFGIQRLPIISKRIRQNFDGMVIDDRGNIEVDDSDDEYSEQIDDELFDDYKPSTKKRKKISVITKSKKAKSSESVSKPDTLSCDLCNVAFTRKDNLSRHNSNKHK